MYQRVKGKVILLRAGCVVALLSPVVFSNVAISEVVDQGLRVAPNSSRAHLDASINRNSEQYQPLNLLNDFYPSIEIRVEDHDNVRRRPGFEENDLLIVANPELAYRTNFGRHDFYAAYNGTFTFHQDFDQEDAQEHLFSTKLGLDLSRRWDLELFGSLGDSFERRGISGGRDFATFEDVGADSEPEKVEFVSYGADLIFGRKIGLLQAIIGYEYTGTDFSASGLSDDVNFSDSRDRSRESIHFDVNWQFSDKLSAFGRVEESNIEYDRSDSTLDSDQINYLLGLRWKPLNALSGTVGFGVAEKTFNDSRRETFDNSIYYANLNYEISPFSTLSFNASRTVEEPGDVDSDFYESELFGAAWSHSLNSKLSLGLYAKAIDDDYNKGREDQFVDWGAEINYAWRNWLSASLYYGEIERESNVNNVAYDDSYFGIRLRSDLRSFFQGSSDEQDSRKLGSFEKLNRVSAVAEK